MKMGIWPVACHGPLIFLSICQYLFIYFIVCNTQQMYVSARLVDHKPRDNDYNKERAIKH